MQDILEGNLDLHLLMSDKAHFQLDKAVNKQNFRVLEPRKFVKYARATSSL